MSTIKHKIWTYDDYYNLNDGKRYEVIEGELIEMTAAPSFKHQTVSTNLFKKIDRYVEENDMGLVRYAPLDIKLNEINTLQPDLIYLSYENFHLIDDRGVFGAPDLVVEILSPSNPNHDKVLKYQIYEKFKVQEYWIVDPKNSSIKIYVLENNKFVLFSDTTKSEIMKSQLLSKLNFNYEQLLK